MSHVFTYSNIQTFLQSVAIHHVLPCTVCRAVVHIQVNDVNEFAPVFREPQYHAAVTESKIYDSILQVEATDQDCSPQYSQICNYQIITTNTPFAIDRNGGYQTRDYFLKMINL